MVDFDEYNPSESYFAAANGYTGFRSYFSDVFKTENFSRIFILKGGPGTGKSSLMKKVHRIFSDRSVKVDRIYCSSDPKSLDGVIIEKDKKSVAIIDGTAPHEWDTRLPGAADEIVNLGVAWNQEKLIESREKIEEITREKTKAYKSAYRYLSLSGEIAKVRQKILTENFSPCCSKLALRYLSNIQNKKPSRNINERLYSAFGKDGYYRLDISGIPHLYAYSVEGKYGMAYIFIDELRRAALREGTDHTCYVSPYSNTLYEGILIGSTLFYIDADFAEKIITDKCFAESSQRSLTVLERLCTEEKTFLNLASEEFSIASDAHFRLEKIYTPCMNFEITDSICNNIIQKINQILFRQ